MTIGPGGSGDVVDVVGLESESLGADAWPGGLVAEGLSGAVPHLSYLVARDDSGLVVGYAAVSTVADVAELQRIAVGPAQRRTGWGRALLRAVDDHARAGGAERVLLEVRETNTGARSLYAAHGYVELARRPRYYRDGATAVVLERRL